VISRLTRPARGVVTRLSSAVWMGYTIDAARGVRPFQRLWSWIVSVAEVDKQRVAIAPAGESLWIRGWSSFDVRKHSRSERALEAGSPVAKPRAWWRVPSGALVDGRHFGSGKPPSLTREWTERLSLPRRIRSPSSAG
jgi:hypothetical protein